MSRAVKRILSIVIMMSIVSLSLSSYATDDSSSQLVGTGLSSVSKGIGVTSVSPGISGNKISNGIPEQIKDLLGQELANFMRALTEEDLVIAIDSLTEKQTASLEPILTESEKITFKALYEEYLKNIEEIINNDFESEISNIGSASNVSSYTRPKKMYMSAAANFENGFKRLNCPPPPEPEPLTLTKTASAANEAERTYTIGLSAILNKDVLVPAQCDIILLLDKSKSMTENYIKEYKLITSPPDDDETYYFKVGSEYLKAKYDDDDDFWYYKKDIDGDGDKEKIEIKTEGGKYKFYEYKDSSKDRLTALIECANSFVSNVAEKSPESRIAVVSFAGAANTEVGLSSVTISGSVNPDITNAINKTETYDYTSHDFAMEKAIEIFNTDGDRFEPRKKIVVMITDGESHREGTKKKNIQNAAKIHAATLKASPINATVYSIGINQGHGGFLDDISGATGGTGQYAFTINQFDELNRVFDGIAAETQVKVQNVVIKDYISPDFEVIDSTLKDGAAKKTDTNGVYIEWTHNLTTKTPFGSSFEIKAKQEFFGGNDVPTNIDEISALYNSGTLVKKFPLPTVNVPINYSVTPKEEIFYAGENVDLAEVEQTMFNADNVTNGNMSYQWRQSGTVLANKTFTAVNDGVYTLDVNYTPATDGTKSAGTPVPVTTKSGDYSISVLKPTVTTADITVFAGDSIDLNKQAEASWVKPEGFVKEPPKLTYKMYDNGREITNIADYVTFNDKVVTVKSYVGSLSLDDSKCVTYAPPNENSFKINVLYGAVTAAKAIDINHEPHGDPVFLFKLERYDGTQLKQTWYDYVRFKDGSIAPQSVTFDKLPKGEYKLTELKTIRYKLNSITDITGGTDSNGAVAFSIGLNNPNGAATFNNIKNNNSLFTHTDVLQNTFTVRSSSPR